MLLTARMLQVVGLLYLVVSVAVSVSANGATPPEDVVELEEGRTASRRKMPNYFFKKFISRN